jgi:phenylacetate-CoA ligase
LNRLLSAFGFYYPVQWLRREPIGAAKSLLARRARLAAADREELDQRLLEDLLNRLWQSPFYRRRLTRGGYTEDQKLQADALRCLPPLTKRDVRESEADLAVPGERTTWRKTSGSTGVPLRFRKDRWATAMMDAVMYDRYRWYGIRVGDAHARLWGRPLDPRGRLRQHISDFGMNRRRLSSFEMTSESVNSYFDALARFRPRWLYAYPNALARAIELASDTHRACLQDLHLRVVICTGEMLFPWQRDLFLRTFGAPIVNEYGSTENGIIGFECPEGRLHAPLETLLLEVQEACGSICPSGTGRLLVTEIHSRSLPFVRYALGDLVTIDAAQCPCGRDGPLLASLQGRVDSFIVLPCGDKVYDAILAYALGGQVRSFRAQQVALDEIRIDIVPALSPGTPTAVEDALRTVRARLGPKMRVHWRAVDQIPPEPSGKLRYFIPLSETGPDAGLSSHVTKG